MWADYFGKGSEAEKLYFGKSGPKETAVWGLRTFTFHRKGLLDLNKNMRLLLKKKKKKEGGGSYVGGDDTNKTNSNKRKGFYGLGEIPAEKESMECADKNLYDENSAAFRVQRAWHGELGSSSRCWQNSTSNFLSTLLPCCFIIQLYSGQCLAGLTFCVKRITRETFIF